MVAPTIPILAASFGVSIGLAAQAVTAGVLGRVLALIPSGIIIDRVGRKPPLLAGPILIAVASLIAATTPSFALLLFAQFLAGAGNSLWSTSREIVMVDVVKATARGRAISGFQGTSTVGMALGPVLGGILSDHFGFRSVFWVYGFLAVLTLLVSLRVR